MEMCKIDNFFIVKKTVLSLVLKTSAEKRYCHTLEEFDSSRMAVEVYTPVTLLSTLMSQQRQLPLMIHR